MLTDAPIKGVRKEVSVATSKAVLLFRASLGCMVFMAVNFKNRYGGIGLEVLRVSPLLTPVRSDASSAKPTVLPAYLCTSFNKLGHYSLSTEKTKGKAKIGWLA